MNTNSTIQRIAQQYANLPEVKQSAEVILNTLFQEDPEEFQRQYDTHKKNTESSYNYEADVVEKDHFIRQLFHIARFSKRQGWAVKKEIFDVPIAKRLANLKKTFNTNITETLYKIMNNQKVIVALATEPRASQSDIQLSVKPRSETRQTRSKYVPVNIEITSLPISSLVSVYKYFPTGYFTYRNKERPVLFAKFICEHVHQVTFIQIDTHESMRLVEGYCVYMPVYKDWMFTSKLEYIDEAARKYMGRHMAKEVAYGYE